MEYGIIAAGVWLFGLLLAVLWLLVPFAIFGIKPLLRKVDSELVKIRSELTAARVARQQGEGR